MQTRKSKKIIIDAVKLETLIRLGCPQDVIYKAITENKITKQGDELIDTLLESLIDIREFTNWGGNHNPTGKNQYSKNNILGQVDHQVDRGQDIGQVVDKDKDLDNKIIKDLKEKEINKEKEKRFSKPSIDEIKSYCLERNNEVDPERFFNFYESKGWKIGNSPMKDWKAAVRTWEAKEKPKQTISKMETLGDKMIKIEVGEFYLDNLMPEYKEETQGLTDDECEKLWQWIYDKFLGQTLPQSKIRDIIRSFNKNAGH